ncbi:ABC transporter ATP-binding protein [Gorillibacterium timonense]|uniref:ABC transporter ATP-binding protein n=1 Tax=Gorillibacterium timonense TaxID=1689269 RepID=UPI001F244D5C|nr:ABC transporter ATP-binding protein [Gorillibacterium timonense]
MNRAAGGMRGEQRGPGGKKARPADSAAALRKIWAYLAVHRKLLLLILLLVLVNSAAGLFAPYLLGRTVDHFADGKSKTVLIHLLIALLGVYVIQLVSGWLQSYWMIGISQKTVFTLRRDLFAKLHQLPISYFAKRRHGEMMSRLTNDIDNVSQTLGTSFIQILSSVLTFIGMLVLMLWLSPLLTLVTLTIVPAMFLGMKWITSRTGPLFKEQQKSIGDLNGFVEETLSGQRIVKTFAREGRVLEEFAVKNERLREAAYYAQTYSGFIPKLMNVLNNASFALIAGVGGLLALKGAISVGVILTFAEYARQFTRPLNDLANQFNTFLSAVAGAERVFEVLEEPEEEEDEREAAELSGMRGEIRFSDVSFSYEANRTTLSEISFHARPGETVALVGPTGAGKTTIVQLLSRFYDPSAGSIFIDGRDTRSIKRKSLRRSMGFVLQDAFLFQGTVRENIRYGRLAATDEEVEAAAQLANAHSFIARLPKGYDTMLSHDGSGISQGQKQLLSIARAILADPALLILDEATSSIDTVTEVRIQEALNRLMEGRTSVVIAHRLGTIQNADRILVLDEGKLVEEGSHRELIEKRSFYYDLYQSQFSNNGGRAIPAGK